MRNSAVYCKEICCWYSIVFIYLKFGEYEPTLADTFEQEVEIDGSKSVVLIFDTAGVDDMPIVKDGYMREADGFLCVYAIDNLESFEEVKKLHEWVLRYEIFLAFILHLRVKENKMPPFLVIGNKADLTEERLVSKEQVSGFIVEMIYSYDRERIWQLP